MWKTFLATFQAPWYIIGMERNQKMGGPTDDDQERQEATDTPDMSRPGATEAHASREHQLLTVKEAVALFNRNGILRSKKSIQSFCQAGALDCTRDPDQNQWYIEPESVKRLIGEIQDIQDRHNDAPAPFTPGATDSDKGATETHDMVRPGATYPNPKEEFSTCESKESGNLTDKVIVEGLLAQLDAKDTQIEAKDKQIGELHVLLKQAQDKIPQLQAGQGSQPLDDQE